MSLALSSKARSPYRSPNGQTLQQAAITPEENERLVHAQTDVHQMILNRQRNKIEDVLNMDRDPTIEIDELQERLLAQRRALDGMFDRAQTSVDTYEGWATGGRPLLGR